MLFQLDPTANIHFGNIENRRKFDGHYSTLAKIKQQGDEAKGLHLASASTTRAVCSTVFYKNLPVTMH
jgi:hypothetical protein